MNEMFMVSHSLNNNTCKGLVISLCLNTNHLLSLVPLNHSNFRHLLSCGIMDCDFLIVVSGLQFLEP